jgi:hypothetical protein
MRWLDRSGPHPDVATSGSCVSAMTEQTCLPYAQHGPIKPMQSQRGGRKREAQPCRFESYQGRRPNRDACVDWRHHTGQGG